MRLLPDPDLSFRDTVDFIFDCALCQRALGDPHPKDLTLLIRDVAALIHRLTASCHLPEFTDHGLPHLCSLFERISTWTSNDKAGIPQPLVDRLSPEESATLVLAVLFHDIGMLSQRPDDLPRPAPMWATKGLSDVPNWVRRTHIQRMDGIVSRGLGSRSGTRPSDATVKRAIAVASAHGSWPHNNEFKNLSPREAALAGVLAVSDLLDEDSNRCDVATLLGHRHGTPLNRAHWIRHGLTADRVKVISDEIQVKLQGIPGAGPLAMTPVFAALRNHYRLALMYRPVLGPLDVNLQEPKFDDPGGVPSRENPHLAGWSRAPSFATSRALSFQLTTTFFPLGLLDAERASATEIALAAPYLEPVDLTDFRRIRGRTEPRSHYEEIAHSLKASDE